MSSVQYLREFVNERLTAAAEQIFLEFEKTIVQYEQEIDRQRRLMDITWKPEIKLHRTDVPQQHVCKEEEVVADQQLWNQETSPNLDQGEPEPPQIKEEQEQLSSSQEGEQLVLKEEIHAFMVTAAEEKDHSEPEPKRDHLNCVSSAVAVREYQGAGKKEGHNNVEYQPTPDSQYPDVQVQVVWSSTGPQLICQSSCFPSGHSFFVWYKNEEEILGESSSLYTKYADGPDSYSCAYEGHCSNPVSVLSLLSFFRPFD
ncbi:uncharacterized protein LOC116315588 isoform X3 [Oreochromis aureus]|uniref:uncharacterized protein LOC116315588 isoform X3 n=1 Tax=Oreochromis aureus TaxID=47969 RepID=UPI001953BD19|nr:uncharacterized protein LOC116315588 isoform X3 [Oreochromis aureus]